MPNADSANGLRFCSATSRRGETGCSKPYFGSKSDAQIEVEVLVSHARISASREPWERSGATSVTL
jgi:hypothetical protein